MRCGVVYNRCIRKLTLLDSINVDTAAAEYASTSGSIKRVGRRICFHQACTPGVCETFLVVLELRFTSDRLYLRYIYLEYCILLFVTRRPRPRYLSWLLLLVLNIGNQGIGGARARPLVRTPGVPAMLDARYSISLFPSGWLHVYCIILIPFGPTKLQVRNDTSS